MNIGFDLDGTVLEQSIGLLRVMNALPDAKQDELLKYYVSGLKMNLNPLDFLADGDELFFITGRSNCVIETTTKWVKKYFPYAKLFLTNVEVTEDKVINFYQAQVKTKSEIINKEKIDVYFEDNPDVVKGLRQVCPNTRIIQYGSRCYL